jgi:hypothetical protein
MPKPKKTTKYRAVKVPTVMGSFGLRDLSAAGLAGAEVFEFLEASDVVEVSEDAEFLGFSELVDMGTSLLLGNEVRCT